MSYLSLNFVMKHCGGTKNLVVPSSIGFSIEDFSCLYFVEKQSDPRSVYWLMLRKIRSPNSNDHLGGTRELSIHDAQDTRGMNEEEAGIASCSSRPTEIEKKFLARFSEESSINANGTSMTSGLSLGTGSLVSVYTSDSITVQIYVVDTWFEDVVGGLLSATRCLSLFVFDVSTGSGGWLHWDKAISFLCSTLWWRIRADLTKSQYDVVTTAVSQIWETTSTKSVMAFTNLNRPHYTSKCKL